MCNKIELVKSLCEYHIQLLNHFDDIGVGDEKDKIRIACYQEILDIINGGDCND